MFGVTSAHHQRQGQYVRFLLVDFVVAALIIVELNAFNAVARNQNIHLAHRAEDTLLTQVLVHMELPLLRASELLFLYELKLASRHVSANRENVEFVLKVHCEGFLLLWEPDKDFLV